MITVKSALPTPKEAWKSISSKVRFIKRTYHRAVWDTFLYTYAKQWEILYNVDYDYIFNDYFLPCIRIYVVK